MGRCSHAGLRKRSRETDKGFDVGGGGGVWFDRAKRRDSANQGLLFPRSTLRATGGTSSVAYSSENPDKLLTKCPSQQHLTQLARY